MFDRIILAPYYLTLKLRHFCYDHGIRKVSTCDVPTICVGNITAGGTGKTPHTEMILRTLLKSDDWAYEDLAVLSRGHRRASGGFQIVTRDGSVKEYGLSLFRSVRFDVDEAEFRTVTSLVLSDAAQAYNKETEIDRDIFRAALRSQAEQAAALRMLGRLPAPEPAPRKR